MGVFRMLAAATLVLHLAWLVWVLGGWVVTRGRPVLRWLHIASLAYGALISVFGWTCPLTYAEIYFQQRAGIASYAEGFIEHYLEAVIYPDVPQTLLAWSGAVVCAGILGVYVARFRQRSGTKSW